VTLAARGVQGGGHALDLLAFAGQARGQVAGGAARAARRLDQPFALGGQSRAQGQELVLRLGGDLAGVTNLQPHGFDSRSRRAGGKGGGREQAFCQSPGAPCLGRQPSALLHQISGDPDQGGRSDGQEPENREREGVALQRRARAGVGR